MVLAVQNDPDCFSSRGLPYYQTPMAPVHYLNCLAPIHSCSFEYVGHRDYAAHILTNATTTGAVFTKTCTVVVECLGRSLKSLPG